MRQDEARSMLIADLDREIAQDLVLPQDRAQEIAIIDNFIKADQDMLTAASEDELMRAFAEYRSSLPELD